MQFKKYLLSKFIHIIPIEETFYFKVKFDKKVKLTDELIALNYKKHAPYKNPFFTTLMEDKHLYVWFYEKEINSRLILPEAYLLFDFFKEKNPNTILSIESTSGYFIIVIKDKILLSAYSIAEEDENLIAMEMNKYALASFKKINREVYRKSKEEAFQNLALNDLYKWTKISLDNNDFLPKTLNFVAYPLSFLLLFMMAVEIHHVNGVEKQLEQIEEKYFEVKSKNDDIREKINYENAKEQKWIDFVHRELPYVDSLSIFTSISKAFNEKKFIFKSFSIVGSRVKINMETKEDFIEGLSLLNKIEGLKNVALKHTNKKRHTVSYEATIVAKGLAL